jgi:hypothetical protein
MRYVHIVLASLCLLTALDVCAADACGLVKPEELQAALGASPGQFAPTTLGAASLCRGQVGKYAVVIRSAALTGQNSDAAKKGIEAMRAAGAQVDVKTDGELTCMTLVAPASTPQLGVNTTCTIARAGRLTGVEISAAAGTQLADMQAVRELVEKAAGRL